MADFSTLGGVSKAECEGYVTASTELTTVTASASTNTKGAWTELVASSSYNTDGIYITISPGVSGASACSCLLDIGVGAAASEVVRIPNLLTSRNTGNDTDRFFFPIHIPSGTRISARLQSTTGSEVRYVGLNLSPSAMLPTTGLQRVTAYGDNTADSGGTSASAGTTANTEVIVEIDASIANPIKAASIQAGLGGDTFVSIGRHMVTLYRGASGSEKELGCWYFEADTNNEYLNPTPTPTFPCDVPAGERLSVGVQSNLNNTANNTFDYIVYGVD